MNKLYIDLAIVAICILLILKYTKLFIPVIIIGLIVWFFVLKESKRNEIIDKISKIYRR